MRWPASLAAACMVGVLASAHVHAGDTASVPIPAAQASLQAAFAPWDDVEGLIVAAIDNAGKQVLVQAYLLTSKEISAALIAARRRGIDVRVLVDEQQLAKAASSKASDLAAAGIPVWVETRYQNAHNKIIVIDPDAPDAVVITGSFNFTWTAQHKNAENILIVRKSPALAGRYALNWERHRQDAVPYKK